MKNFRSNKWKNIFTKKNINICIWAYFFYNFANALIETFGTVMLYRAGLPIYLILLIYGIRFLITGCITPLFVTIIIIFVIAMGLMGFSNPSSDSLSCKYVRNEHRGKFNSLYFISKILGTVFASLLVAWGVISNNIIVLFSVIVIFFILQYIMILQIDYKPQKKSSTLNASIKYLLHSKSKYKIIYALRTNHIIERLFVCKK